MNKSEIQERIEKVESELATLKADLAKCEDGIEQEKCWHVLFPDGECTVAPLDLDNCKVRAAGCVTRDVRPAYMPECRQVTVEDWMNVIPEGGLSNVELVKRLHKLGFRIKVTP